MMTIHNKECWITIDGQCRPVSCGISSTALGARTPLELIDQADKALYAAKESGRNYVMVLDPIIAGANASDGVSRKSGGSRRGCRPRRCLGKDVMLCCCYTQRSAAWK